MFVGDAAGALVNIAGTDPRLGDWRHKAFVPAQLPTAMPELSMPTVLAVVNAGAEVPQGPGAYYPATVLSNVIRIVRAESS